MPLPCWKGCTISISRCWILKNSGGAVLPQYRKKAEALQAAISALEELEELERNKAKARKTLTALRRCHDYPELCDGCPYRDATITACGEQLDYDIEELLAAAYEEGGENDEQS